MRHAFVRVRMAPVVAAMVLLMAGNAFTAPPNKPSGPGLPTPTQNWDTVLPADERFTVLGAFNSQAVRDNETGLVWERSPSTTPMIWYDAVSTCWQNDSGNRKGWRLPTIEELSSLVDPSVASPGPKLPPGHPFQNVQNGGLENEYWSTTTGVRNPPDTSQAWVVRFHNGTTGDSGKSGSGFRWCVRGGTNADKYK